MPENQRGDLRDLRYRVEHLEQQLVELLEARRWGRRAVGVIALTVVGQIIYTLIRHGF